MKKWLPLIFVLLFQNSQSRSIDDTANLKSARLAIDSNQFVNIADRDYYISSNSTATIDDAAKICDDIGMVLVSFETYDEFISVSRYILRNESVLYYYITSGNEHNDQWVWIGTGQDINYFLWAYENPNSPPEYNATIIFHALYGWYDHYGDVPWYYICEQK